jgi:hypothetical protein
LRGFRTLYLGIEFGDEKVYKWLTSLIISVLSSILLTQPLQVILITFFFVLVFRKHDDNEGLEYDHEDDNQPINKHKQIKKYEDGVSLFLLKNKKIKIRILFNQKGGFRIPLC